MGYQVGSRCHDTLQHATDDYFSSTRPALTPGSITYEGYYSYYNGASGLAWYQCRSQVSATGVRSAGYCFGVSPVSFQTCTETSYLADGATLGWGVGLALIAAWGFARLARFLR